MPVLNLRSNLAEAEALPELMAGIGRRARQAARQMALASAQAKDIALRSIAERIRANGDAILRENARDVAAARAGGHSAALIDRLVLDPGRLAGIAEAVEKVGALPDPVGRQLAAIERPNGLLIERVAVPLGVVGVIFESRPNVTADAGALCLKAGNAAILRAGSDSHRSAVAIAQAMSEGLAAAGLPADAIQIVPTRDRAAVGLMLAGLDGCVDVIVPRGGRGLVERVQAEARVPVFAHLDGINHVYVARAADLAMARTVLLNSKMRRVGVCGAAETLLVDRACAHTHLAPLVAALLDAGCAVRGDSDTRSVDPRVTAATAADWDTEYLDAVIAVRVVDGLDAAIEHIETHGSHHTDAIITEDSAEAARFLAEVDSAIVTHNASTQFADGGEFGFGAEIGIATGRMHARGPVGVEQLTTFKYRVHGSGQTRP
ncbi:glutamate-5-semialdehyde dehydrogenase [Methylobacterium sp. NEAU 140]|uniref:glutamate-5-semialdehyde dehydrogenase n=1 Tax=Methylobacterium sp. NEAU 140 TaxID=3064945 RepID=UPI0027335343|nr:glutamate-5-semialdehyde dehydrogenase [Methylobacterium sp. NEAU 140]MDP4023068.1 glutamate-5-semialdehyde dehydrogenase [Methylobacterium sp. NEAU 140]